jgi:hypothetical protein
VSVHARSRSSRPSPARRFVAAAVAAVCLTGVTSGCGDDQRMPAAATTCEQLMTAAAEVVRGIVRDLQGKSEADLRVANSEDPFGALQRPLDPYRTRADELGCDRAELRRAACRSYRDIAPNGPAAEEFLAQMIADCLN